MGERDESDPYLDRDRLEAAELSVKAIISLVELSERIDARELTYILMIAGEEALNVLTQLTSKPNVC